MIHKHKLLQPKYNYFLNQNRQDPITGDAIQENDIVVVCAVCKSAFLIDSWEYMNGQHCNQSSTLKKIPREISLVIKQERAKPNRQTNIARNETYRIIFVLLALILPMSFYGFCMINYLEATDTGFLMTGAFLTAGICAGLIMFADTIFKI